MDAQAGFACNRIRFAHVEAHIDTYPLKVCYTFHIYTFICYSGRSDIFTFYTLSVLYLAIGYTGTLFTVHKQLGTFELKHLPNQWNVLLDVSLTIKAATLIFISGCSSAI